MREAHDDVENVGRHSDLAEVSMRPGKDQKGVIPAAHNLLPAAIVATLLPEIGVAARFAYNTDKLMTRSQH